MTIRYAYIDISTNKTVWGPGPNPYFITLLDGTMWEVAAHTAAESEQKGVYIVEQVDKRDYDPLFEQQETPVYKLKNGRPIEVYKYTFVPAARENMLDGIDAHAEKMRASFATKYAGQYEEYVEAYNEALEVAALDPAATIAAGAYPFLEADVGVTFAPLLQRAVANVREAAQLVIQTREMWKIAGSDVRTRRLAAKKSVREAATDAIAYQLYKDYINGNTNET